MAERRDRLRRTGACYWYFQTGHRASNCAAAKPRCSTGCGGRHHNTPLWKTPGFPSQWQRLAIELQNVTGFIKDGNAIVRSSGYKQAKFCVGPFVACFDVFSLHLFLLHR